MKIIPLGGETLGVRSMATFVETEDVCILIDPGLSVVSIIHSLPPTPFELRALSNVKENIRKASKRAHVVVITHYHNDHFSMDPSLYRGKEVFIKDPEKFISNNQKRRARELLKSISSIANIHYTTGEFRFGGTEIMFSPIFTPFCISTNGPIKQLFAIEQPPTEWKSIIDVFEKTYEHEGWYEHISG